jgi:hypothetical protein
MFHYYYESLYVKFINASTIMLIVMFQVGKQVPPVQDVPPPPPRPPPANQYVTLQQPIQSQTQRADTYVAFQHHEQLLHQFEQVCFINLCFVIVYIVC